MKKLLTAVILVALMGTASFAQKPVKQATTAKQTEQVAHKKHHKKAGRKSPAKHKKHSKGSEKTSGSTAKSH